MVGTMYEPIPGGLYWPIRTNRVALVVCRMGDSPDGKSYSPRKCYMSEKKKYSTQDEGPQNASAGKLTPKGISFRMCFIKEHEGKFKDQNGDLRAFYIAEGYIEDDHGREQEFSFLYGSKKLNSVLNKVLTDYTEGRAVGAGVWINVSGTGEGYDREYEVEVLDEVQTSLDRGQE